MPPLSQHPILKKSFALIDAEIGEHAFKPAEYAILRRIIHSTADFDFVQHLSISVDALNCGIAALQSGCPVVVDVGMVRQGCQGMMARTFQNPLITAVDLAVAGDAHQTLTATGMIQAWKQYPQGIYVIGNAPTALEALCDHIADSDHCPPLVIGVPVGFVGVVAAKQQLAALPVPQIRIDGRKGGSPVAAAILNALIVQAWEALP